jgi:hypothetical protein
MLEERAAMATARVPEPCLSVWHGCNGKGQWVSEADWRQAIGAAGRFPANGEAASLSKSLDVRRWLFGRALRCWPKSATVVHF